MTTNLTASSRPKGITALPWGVRTSCGVPGTPLERGRRASPIHLTKHEVETAHDGDDVRYQYAFHEFGQDRDVRERGGTDLQPVRSGATVGDDVVTHLPFGVLGPHVRLTLRHLDDLRHFGLKGSGRDGINGLDDHPGRFANLVDAYFVPGVAVALVAGDHVEIELVVRQVVLDFPQIERHPRATQVRPGDAVGGCLLRGHHADPFGASEEDLVAADELVELVAHCQHPAHRIPGTLVEAFGQVLHVLPTP